MHLHPQSEELRLRLRECLAQAGPWEGTWYRATTIEYANRHDLLVGIGSRQAGGRWNPSGVFNAVYGCVEPETAMAEALANYREFGVPVSQAMPLVFVAVNVRLQAVLDLSAPAIQRAWGLASRRLVAPSWRRTQDRGDEALTQSIGRLAWEEKLEGILVPSARVRRATNIVLFPSRRLRGSSWRIQHARSLPRREATSD